LHKFGAGENEILSPLFGIVREFFGSSLVRSVKVKEKVFLESTSRTTRSTGDDDSLSSFSPPSSSSTSTAIFILKQ
jgi:hypothetical protein